MSQSDDSIHEDFLVTYSFSFLFNKLEKVDSFLFLLFNSVKKRVGKLYQQPKICTFRENLIFLSLSTDGKLSNSKPNTTVKLVIIDSQNVKKTSHICSNNMQGFAAIFASQTEKFRSQRSKYKINRK